MALASDMYLILNYRYVFLFIFPFTLDILYMILYLVMYPELLFIHFKISFLDIDVAIFYNW